MSESDGQLDPETEPDEQTYPRKRKAAEHSSSSNHLVQIQAEKSEVRTNYIYSGRMFSQKLFCRKHGKK
jgi:hypothetical protein